MWDERENPRRRRTAGTGCVLLILAIAGSQGSALRAQRAEVDPVLRLRCVLEADLEDLSVRDRAVKQCLTALHSLSDLQRAVVLVEWRESFPDAETAAVDRANQAQLLERFSSAVRHVLRQGDPQAVADTILNLAAMADTLRASGGAIDVVRCFAPELAHLAAHGPAAQRAAAAQALAQIEAPVDMAAPVLAELLQANETELRLAAADAFAVLIGNALQAVGSGAAIQRPTPRRELVGVAGSVLAAVERGLNDSRPDVRGRCLQTIGLAANALTKLLDDSAFRPTQSSEDEQLQPLISALHDRGPALVRMLGDADAATRTRTHKTLEEIGLAREHWLQHREWADVSTEEHQEDPLGEVLSQALPGLAAALQHPDLGGRRSALDALETCGPLALPVLPALTRALHDPDRFVRWSAIRTVGKLGSSAPPQAIADLTRLLRDPDLGLRKAAATALARLRTARSQNVPPNQPQPKQ